MKPPILATWLLGHFGVSESVVGDLVERYRRRPSSSWYWRQALSTIVVHVAATIWNDKWTTAKAVLIGWAVLVVLSSVPMANVGVLGGWFPTLFFGLVSGWLVAAIHRTGAIALIVAVISTLVLPCAIVSVALFSEQVFTPASARSVTFAAFAWYVQIWTLLSSIGLLIGGFVAVRPVVARGSV
jgi:hypothetical protein